MARISVPWQFKQKTERVYNSTIFFYDENKNQYFLKPQALGPIAKTQSISPINNKGKKSVREPCACAAQFVARSY